MDKRKCASNSDDCRLSNGNCPYSGSDGLPVQCVGPWVNDKYFYLNNILKATSPVRKNFFTNNNAVYIDLFSGPGKCIIKGDQKELKSGCIISDIENFLFNKSIFIDIDEKNTNALRSRLGNPDCCHIINGDLNEKTPIIVKDLLKQDWRYHFAYIDPFNCDDLKFSTIKELARLKRMDLFINFPIGSIKRAINTWIKTDSDTPLDLFLGTKQWRDKIQNISQNRIYDTLSTIYKNQLTSIGYPLERLNAVSVKNTKNVILYVIIFAAKHHIGQKIWNSILKIRPNRQKELF